MDGVSILSSLQHLEGQEDAQRKGIQPVRTCYNSPTALCGPT